MLVFLYRCLIWLSIIGVAAAMFGYAVAVAVGIDPHGRPMVGILSGATLAANWSLLAAICVWLAVNRRKMI